MRREAAHRGRFSACANIQFFGESYRSLADQWQFWPGAVNQVAQYLMDFGTQGGFLAMFALLFGYSTVLLSGDVPGPGFRMLYMRRLGLLGVIGMAHGLLVWYGDILLHYVILGFVLLSCMRCKPRTWLVLAFACLALVPVIEGVTVITSCPSDGETAGGRWQPWVWFLSLGRA